jgi:hypothetical protein
MIVREYLDRRVAKSKLRCQVPHPEPSLTAAAAAMYSASTVEALTVACRLLLQQIAPPPIMNR